jgi:hypothetical protein
MLMTINKNNGISLLSAAFITTIIVTSWTFLSPTNSKVAHEVMVS